MPEDTMAAAIMAAHEVIQQLCDLQQELIDKVGVQKEEFVPPEPDGLYDIVVERYEAGFKEANRVEGKHARHDAVVELREQAKEALIPDPDAEGLPWWWELVWKLEVMQKGVEGEEITFGDTANVLRTNIEQIYGGYPSLDGCPIAEGKPWVLRKKWMDESILMMIVLFF